MRDVNDTGFELVLGRDDWFQWSGLQSTDEDMSERVVYDTRTRSAKLRRRLEALGGKRGRLKGTVLGDAQRSSAARDRYGNWYWIDPADRTQIRVRNSGDGSVEAFWPPRDSPASQAERRKENRPGSDFRTQSSQSPSDVHPPLGALTITRDHRLVGGLSATDATSAPPGLLVFDLHGGGPPRRLSLPGVSTFDPIDATRRRGGGCYFLDRASPQAGGPGRIWAFDRALQVEGPARPPEGATFNPVEESSDDVEASRSSRGPFLLPAGHSSVRVQTLLSLPDGTILVLFTGRTNREEGGERMVSALLRYDLFPDEAGQDPPTIKGRIRLDKPLSEAGVTQPETDLPGWKAHDAAFLDAPAGLTELFRGTLYAVGGAGNQAFAFDLWGDSTTMEAELRMEEIPLRRFSGKDLVATGDRVYYDFEDRWLPLTARPRRRFVTEGQIISPSFDSEIPACTWHRLFVDGCIPPEASVKVESRSADRSERLSDQPWQPEPELYLRDTGSELPYHRPFSASEREREGTGTWELLFQRAEGRYLQLRLTFEGDGRTSPFLHALRIYAPRFSYLDEYFPDVYQQDAESAHFFERCLANVEGTFTALEGRIAHAETLFDTRTVPDEYLDWLASWFGTEFDPALDDRRKRLFLDHAVELYNQRGTPRGLARMLTLALDPCADESLFTAAGVASAIGRPDEARDEAVRQFGVRIVEEFATRDVPRASVGDATVPEQPTQVRVDDPWTPADGADVLNRRFAQFLDTRYAEGEEPSREDVWPNAPSFPPLLPSRSHEYAAQRRSDWRTFTRRIIEGPYAEIEGDPEDRSPADRPDPVTRRYRAFLRRRYGRIDELTAKWPNPPGSFARVPLPEKLPTGTKLRDWIDFVTLALPVDRSAHRFRVLVPVEPEEEISVQRDRLNVARRISKQQKPAHTAVTVEPYWAAFRVGAVRTGLDTVLGAGSRYSDLLVGADGLGNHTVGGAHPADVPERRVAGRDAPDAATPL